MTSRNLTVAEAQALAQRLRAEGYVVDVSVVDNDPGEPPYCSLLITGKRAEA